MLTIKETDAGLDWFYDETHAKKDLEKDIKAWGDREWFDREACRIKNITLETDSNDPDDITDVVATYLKNQVL